MKKIGIIAFGRNHAKTAPLFMKHGLVYREMGKYKKAKDLYEQTIKIGTAAFGRDYAKVASMYCYLFLVYICFCFKRSLRTSNRNQNIHCKNLMTKTERKYSEDI